MTRRARMGRAVALSVLFASGVSGWLTAADPLVAMAAVAQDCGPPPNPGGPCSTITVVPPVDTTSTTVEEASTSTSRVTSTTVRQTTTTRAASQSATRLTTTTLPVVKKNLLVPGDGTQGAALTTTTLDTHRIGTGGVSDGTLIALVVIGLLLVASVVGVLTWRYWTATQPAPAHKGTTSRSARSPR